ncbi:molybdopterin dinucleotide binding domain-containing protein, partial [Streptomyces sp. MBT53]|uniref:molybdopterin dinucleotide binding domain-containing protein n=1 Tax=Streptomyces sp. MBT53 TaxID=1488384 RepID=UPI0019125E85
FMVSVDPYLNETARHADVVLPPPPPSQSPHHDFAFNTLAVRNQVRYSRPAIPLEPGRMAETEILARLILAASGMHGADPAAVDTMVIDQTLGKAVTDPNSPVHGRDPREIADRLTGDTGPERRLDMMLRLGPYGDGFGVRPEGLSLQQLLAHPHGIDLGPLASRLPQPLRTRSGKVELLPQPIVDDLPRLRQAMSERADGLVLVGRRHLRSNNSWMHNVPALTGGTNRCTLHIHPEDAERLGVVDGAPVRVKGAGGEVTAPAEITDGLRRGVVSLPHGWGHDRPGTRLNHAATDPGVNVNQLLDGSLLDPLSGNAVLNGVPVEVAALTAPL